MLRLRSVASLLTILLVIPLVACDSGDPIDQPTPADVAGTYQFTRLYFQPRAQGVTPVNVLAGLDSVETALRLSADGTYFLSYQQRQNNAPFYLIGSFVVTARTVQLTGNEEQQSAYQRILLDRTTTLRRIEEEPRVLTADVEKTVNLEQYDPQQYAGLSSVPGTLQIRLLRR